MSNIQRLIFDIETIGIDFDKLDDFSKEYIKRFAKTEEELEEKKQKLGFSPLTGEIVAIGVLNPDTNKGAVYLRTENDLPDELEPGIILNKGDEREIIRKFWEVASHYNEFITFNGRKFDVPFLLIRSAILEVKPTKNLMSNRFLNSQSQEARHIDLLDQFTFYGASNIRSNIHFWTKAFGVDSPKDKGITGEDIKKLWQEEKFLEIAKYNLGDLRATKELYQRWKEFLNL